MPRSRPCPRSARGSAEARRCRCAPRSRERGRSTWRRRGRPRAAWRADAAVLPRDCRCRRSCRSRRFAEPWRRDARSRSRLPDSAARSRSKAPASPRGRGRRRHAGRSEPGCRRCRAAPQNVEDRRGSARAPPRASRLGTRCLVWRAWSPTRPLVQVVVDRRMGRTPKLMVIGTLAGLFSGLFGVGGGTVIVPLLVLWLAYDERTATATSLAAIVFIAAFGAAVQGLYGNVDVIAAVEIGLPAVGGVLLGFPAVAGAASGVVLANALSGEVLRDGFAVMIIIVAAQLARRALRDDGSA